MVVVVVVVVVVLLVVVAETLAGMCGNRAKFRVKCFGGSDKVAKVIRM